MLGLVVEDVTPVVGISVQCIFTTIVSTLMDARLRQEQWKSILQKAKALRKT